MKIGYDAKRFFHNKTGLGNYSRDLIRVLSKYYPDNDYFLYNPKKSNKEKTLNYNIQEILPKGKLAKKFPSVWRQKGIVKQLVADKIKIYHGLSGELPRGINKINIKTVVTIHDLIFIRYPKLYSFFDRKIHFNKFKYATKIADVVIAISEQTKRDIIEFLNVNPEKITVLYQGCNNVFKNKFSEEEKRIVQKKYNLPKKFILNVGTIEKRKNLLNIIKAIKITNDELVVIGSDKSEYAKEVKQYIKTNNLLNKVHFLKNVSITELAIIYQTAKIFIYPSIFEGFGIPVIEALYSKTPVITSINGCFLEAGGSYSYYIEPNDVNSIINSILKISKEEDSVKERVKKSYKFVQKFNDEIIANKMINLYNNLLK